MTTNQGGPKGPTIARRNFLTGTASVIAGGPQAVVSAATLSPTALMEKALALAPSLNILLGAAASFAEILDGVGVEDLANILTGHILPLDEEGSISTDKLFKIGQLSYLFDDEKGEILKHVNSVDLNELGSGDILGKLFGGMNKDESGVNVESLQSSTKNFRKILGYSEVKTIGDLRVAIARAQNSLFRKIISNKGLLENLNTNDSLDKGREMVRALSGLAKDENGNRIEEYYSITDDMRVKVNEARRVYLKLQRDTALTEERKKADADLAEERKKWEEEDRVHDLEKKQRDAERRQKKWAERNNMEKRNPFMCVVVDVSPQDSQPFAGKMFSILCNTGQKKDLTIVDLWRKLQQEFPEKNGKYLESKTKVFINQSGNLQIYTQDQDISNFLLGKTKAVGSDKYWSVPNVSQIEKDVPAHDGKNLPMSSLPIWK